MKKLDNKEFNRQLFHLFLGVIIVLLLVLGLLTHRLLVLTLVIGGILSMISLKWKLPFITWLLEVFDRKDVKFPGEGAFYYVFGCTLALYLFSFNIALASIMILALGDSFSHIIGKQYGRKRFGAKTFVGTMSGIFFGFFGAFVFVNPSMAFFGASISMLIEAIELRVKGFIIDDNLLIPIVSGIVMQMVGSWF